MNKKEMLKMVLQYGIPLWSLAEQQGMVNCFSTMWVVL